MYTDSSLKPIQDTDQYIAADGTQYPYDFPKDEIQGLTLVTETAAPTDPTLVVTGFIIDENFNQVWQTRPQTADEQAGAIVTLLNNLATHRYAVANGGTVINGIPLATDNDSRADLMGVFIAAQANPAFTVNWKGEDGKFVALNAQQIAAIFVGGMTFIQKCFNAEAALIPNVAQYQTTAAIVAAFDQVMKG